MKRLLFLSVILFCIFPFTRILPIETYNQPYALVCSMLIFLFRPAQIFFLPFLDRVALLSLLLIGMGLLVFHLIFAPNVSLREILYVISYVSPVLIAPCVYFALAYHSAKAKRLLELGTLTWVVVGLVQQFVFADFLTFLSSSQDQLGTRLLDSGRGVVSLAPESTHHGLHLFVLATSLALLGGKRWIVTAALLAAIFLSRSSSVFICVVAGFVFWSFVRPGKRSSVIAVVFILLFAFGDYFANLQSSSRLLITISRIFQGGIFFLLIDQSANMRFMGVVMPIDFAISNFMLPNGISISRWLEVREHILNTSPQVIELSRNGPASGFGLFLFQAGFFALVPLFVFFKRFLWDFRQHRLGLLTSMSLFVFVGQLYLATPSFGLLYGTILWYLSAARQNKVASRGNPHGLHKGAGVRHEP